MTDLSNIETRQLFNPKPEGPLDNDDNIAEIVPHLCELLEIFDPKDRSGHIQELVEAYESYLDPGGPTGASEDRDNFNSVISLFPDIVQSLHDHITGNLV